MADYDLGSARGRIIIDEDTRGASEASRHMAELAAAAKVLDRNFRTTEGAMNRMESNLKQTAESLTRVQRAAQAFDRGLDAVGRTAQNTIGQIVGLNTATNTLERSMARAITTVRDLRSNIEDFTSASSIISKLASSFIGLEKTFDAMPNWVRTTRNVSAGIVAFGATATRILPRVGTAFRAAAVALGLMSPRLASVRSFLGPVGALATTAARALGNFGQGVVQAARGVGQMVLGGALLRNAFTGIAQAAKIAAIAVGGLSLGGAGMSAIGTVALGLANAIKQLSGAFLLLPGAILGAGIAGGVAKLAFKGMGDAMKAAFGPADKFNDAIKELSPTMQSIAKATQKVAPEFKKLQELASATVLSGFGTDIEKLSKQYLPTLKTGVGNVASALNSVKNGFRDFLSQPATVKDLGSAFSDTSTIVQNFARAIWPVSAALRDIAVVGLDVLSELSGGIGLAGKRFGDFISEARRTGELKTWMKEGVQGFRDLGATIKATAQAFKTIFQAFGANGDNALERMRASAERFRDAMRASASGGGLDTFASALQRMSNVSLDVVQEALRQLLNVMQKMAPFAEAMSTAFSSTLLPALKAIGAVAGLVASSLSSMSGLGSVVGVILALGVAMKALQLAMFPITRTATAAVGAFSLFRGVNNTIAGINTSMAAMGAGARVAGVRMGAFGTAIAAVGQRAPVIANMQQSFVRAAAAANTFGRTAGTMAAAMTGLKAAGSGLLSVIGGPWVAAIAAAVAIGYSFVAQSRDAAKYQELLAEKAKATATAAKGFTTAFKELNGVMGKGVFQEGVKQIDAMKNKLEETSKVGSGVMSDIGAFFKDKFSVEGLKHSLDTTNDGFVRLNNRANSALDHIGQDAQRAKASLDELGWSSDRLGSAITGSQQQFDGLINALRNTSNGGQEAVAEVSKIRAGFTNAKSAMDAVGPAAIQLGNALDVIADKSASASEKLDAMKSALEAMGLLQVSAVEAMASVQEAIQNVDEALAQPIGNADQLGAALIKMGTDGKTVLNDMNPAASNLWNAVKPLSESLRQVAISGGDVQGAFSQMQPALEAIRQQAGLSVEQWRALSQTMGLVPDHLQTMYQLNGSDEATRQLYVIAAQIKGVPNNKSITVQLSDPGLITKLKEIGVQVTSIDQATGTAHIQVNSDEVRTKLNQIFTQVRDGATGQITLGSNLPTIQQQQAQITAGLTGLSAINPSLQINTNIPQVQSQVGGLTGALLGLSNMPPIPAPPVQAPQSPPVEPPAVGEQTPLPAPTVTPPQSPPVQPPAVETPIPAPPVETPKVPTPEPPAIAPIAAPIIEKPVIPAPDPIAPASVTADTGPAIAALESLNAAIATNAGKWNDIVSAITTAMSSAASSISSFVSTATSTLAGAASGARDSGAALGQGFADGIQSKVGAVRAAALALAEAAAAPLPRSPAKIGPFSGTGWTPYRGASLVKGFAEGISDNIGLAKLASMDMATAISSVMDSIRTTFNLTPTSFEANRTPGPSGSRYYRDPTVTDADIASKRATKAKEKAEKEAEDARFAESDKAKEDAKEAAKSAEGTSKSSKKAIGSMEELAKKFNLTITSNKRDEPGSFHNTGEAYDFSGSPEDMARLNKYLAQNDPFARELFYDPGFNIDEGKKTGAIGGHGDHVHYVPSLNKTTEQDISNTAKNTEKATSSQSDIVDAIVAEGKKQGLSDEDIAAGVATGLVESNLQDLPDIPNSEFDSEGVFQQRPSMGWGDASESVSDDARQFFEQYRQTDPSLTPGQRAQAVQRSAFPDKYGQRMSEAQALTAQSLARQGNTLDTAMADNTKSVTAGSQTQEEILDEIRNGNTYLGEQIRIAENPSSSDADVIRALQAIDDEIATTGDRDVHDGLESVRDAVMDDRGIKKYDPNEGASTDVTGDSIKLAQAVVGLFDTVKDGLDNAVSTLDLVIRGVSNTKEVNQVIDGFQSMASTVSEIVSTVGEVVNIVASFAALASMAIPGIGQVATVVSAVTGGISQVNTVIDLIQEVASIAGMFIGGALSWLAGGAGGPLQGNISVLLDTNDNTIKTWSDDDPSDKRVHQLPGGNPGGNQQIGINNLQIYQGPSSSTDQVLRDTMHYVRATQTGAYAG